MAEHHLEASPKTVHWGYWDAALPPVLQIESGDIVTVETISGEPEDLPPDRAGVSEAQFAIHENCQRGPGPHILTGPISVRGARRGQVLEVDILDIALADDWGWNLIEPLLGTLPEDFPERRRLTFPIDRERRVAKLPWGLELPLRPFFGNFGVAPPPNYGRITSIIPREHGGNMDNKELVAGTKVCFPIWNDGALFSVGDGHGVQGDGEVCLTAVETGLTGRLRLTVRRDVSMDFPRAETPSHYISMGMDEDLDDAARQALRRMVAWITEMTSLSRQDAYSLCSIAADLRVTQMVDVNKGAHCMLPKSVLA
jgi:acetamidase/formamidase